MLPTLKPDRLGYKGVDGFKNITSAYQQCVLKFLKRRRKILLDICVPKSEIIISNYR